MNATHSQRITSYKLPLATLIAIVFTLTFTLLVSAQGPTPTDDDVNRVARQLYCPVCENTPLDVCPTEACRQWRDLIRSMLAEGKSEAQIKQYFVDHYGARVLGEPPNHLVSYLVPGVIILLGALLLARGFQLWMKPSLAKSDMADPQGEAQQPVDPYVARLEEELKKQK